MSTALGMPTYIVAFPNPQAHYFRVSLRFDWDSEEGPVLTLPAWIPGSYMIRDFAKNIVELSASVDGRTVPVERLDKQSWRLPSRKGRVDLSYRVYARDLSVRGAHLDDSHAYFNGTSLFLKVKGLEAGAHALVIEQPASSACTRWRVATTLPAVEVDESGFGHYRAADYDALIDHPVEIAELAETAFEVDGVPHRMVFQGRQRADLNRISADMARICAVHGEMFGFPLPLDQYLFMTTVVGDGYGGLEHRDSTSLMCSRGDLPTAAETDGARATEKKPSEGYRRFLGLCSHEYFHLWNVKRIRPARLMRSDLSGEAYTTLLWAFEGITSYYDDLALVRSGVIDAPSYLELLAQAITRLRRSFGRHRQSVAESSFYAWTKFYKQDENAPNAIVSYYTKGALVALGLDATLRELTADRLCLDDLMRTLWERFGRTGIGVPESGIEQLAAELAGRDLEDFFNAFVRGTDELPLEKWLEGFGIGMRLRPAKGVKDEGGIAKPEDGPLPARPVLGATFVSDPAGARITRIFEGGAAHESGLSADDVIVAVDGLRVSSDNLADRVAEMPTEGELEVHAFRRDELRVYPVRPRPAPEDTCDLWLLPPEGLTPETLDRRKRWLGAGIV